MRTRDLPLAVLAAIASACGGDDGGGSTTDTAPRTTAVGEPHAGQYNLGPVAFEGSFPNSCAPYTPALEQQVGPMLAGLALAFNGNGSLCDACILVKTAKGKSVVAHVITTGDTHDPNDVDLSRSAYDALDVGEYPRSMTWELTPCAPSGTIEYQFQTEANPYWTSLWVRNARLPLASVEVKGANHADFAPLARGPDGTLTDDHGFGDGPFTLRVTAQGGEVVTDSFSKFDPGAVVSSSGQFN
jgi:hypothetical protein